MGPTEFRNDVFKAESVADLTGSGLTKQLLYSPPRTLARVVDAVIPVTHDMTLAGRNSGNSRDGSTPKTVTTEIGTVVLNVPCDRENSYEPQIVRKHQRRWVGFDEARLRR